HDVELLDVARLGPGEDLVEADFAGVATGQLLALETIGALLRLAAGFAVVVDRLHELAGVGDAVESQDLDRHAGNRFGDDLAAEVMHRPDPAPLRAGDQRVA